MSGNRMDQGSGSITYTCRLKPSRRRTPGTPQLLPRGSSTGASNGGVLCKGAASAGSKGEELDPSRSGIGRMLNGPGLICEVGRMLNGPGLIFMALALLLAQTCLPVAYSQTAPPPQPPRVSIDRDTLMEIKAALMNYSTTVYYQPRITGLLSWNATTYPCDTLNPWEGVECGGENNNKRVTSLDLRGDNFRGPIPTQIRQLNFLTALRLGLNRFNGTIPVELFSLSLLTELELEFNKLEGSIPDAISALTNLRRLAMSSNLLNSTLTPSIGSLTKLTYLDVSSNQLEGLIPDSLSKLFYLEYFILTTNQFTGPIPTWLDQLPNLKSISLKHNQMNGSLPSFDLPISLEHFYLGFNNLSGPLPSNIGLLTSLSTLFLPNNNLSGVIPESFYNLSSLSLLDLSSNPMLSGPIPDFLEDLQGLALLQLTGCNFTGSIPATLSSLTNLRELYLDENHLTESIPEELGNLTALTQLYLSQNHLTGPIPSTLCSLTEIQTLDLAHNALYGTIPECLVSVESMKALILSDNLLTGTVPQPVSTLDNLLIEDNCLQDSPNQLATCVKTWDAPPVETPPAEEPGPPSSLPTDLTSPSDSSSPTATWHFPLWASVTLVLLAFAFLGFLAYSFSYSITSIAASGANRPDQLPVAEYSLSKIKKSTKNFTTTYGRGSFGTVYLGEDFRKGTAEPRVIIKRATDPQKLGEFLFKCKVEVLARARHRYLVNLLGYCVGKGERILVYEFLPNGTLFDRLHRPELEPLAWDVRVRIAVSVACALEHLHHGLTPPLVHRAVTSSNILLAADMTAKLSDFGIARGNLGTTGSFDDTPRRRSKARGGPGSRGPGGGGAGGSSGVPGAGVEATTQGILQLEKVDVYGFGVVLLELITGQKAMKEVHITSVAAPFLEDPQMMPLMVDPQLGGFFNQSELVELATIARDCVRDDPALRPSMRDVLQAMEDRLRLDTTLFENLDVGDDMLTEVYSGAGGNGAVPALANPPHVQQSSSSSSNPAWQAVESITQSVRNIISPANSRQPSLARSQQGNPDDFEMSSLLVMSARSGDSDNGSSSGRLLR